jgi:hypothetical protein
LSGLPGARCDKLAETLLAVVLAVLVKPESQRRIRVIRRIRDRLVSWGGAVLPGQAAGRPVPNPQHMLETTNGHSTFGLKVPVTLSFERRLFQLRISQQPFEPQPRTTLREAKW